MSRLEPSDIKEIGLLKHYRIIRRWACRNNNLTDADLELLIYFDCMEFFTKQDYKIEEIEAVQQYFEVSRKEAKEYIDMLPKEELIDITQKINGK